MVGCPSAQQGMRMAGRRALLRARESWGRTMEGAVSERDRLAHLLAGSGSSLDADAVDALIAGVLAAPPEIGTRWHALVAEPTPPELAAALDARKAELAVSHHDG